MITLDVIRTTARFAALAPEWTALVAASRSDCVFLTWEWLFTWWQTCGHGKALLILAVRRDGRLIGLAPLVRVRCALSQMPPLHRLEFLGAGQAGSDYLDIIARTDEEPAVVDALAAHLAQVRDVLALTQVAQTGSVTAALAGALWSRHWTLTRSVTDVCPFVDLRSTDWPGYLSARAPSTRYNFRRRLRTLERTGATTFEFATTEAQRAEALARLIACHLRRWRTRGGSSAFEAPDLLDFHTAFTRLALARGWLRLFTLRVGTTPVASLYCLRYGTAMHFYQSGFDDAWTRQSVGLVAMGLAIKASIEEGALSYDLLHGDEAYKSLWAVGRRTLERLEVYPAHSFGSLCRRAMDAKRTARRAVRALWPTSLSSHVQNPS